MTERLWPGWLAYSVVTYTFLNLAVIVPPVVDSFDVTVGRAGLIGTVLNIALGSAAAWLTFRHLAAKPALMGGFALQAVGNLASTTTLDHWVYLGWALPTGVGMGMALAGGYRVVVSGSDVGRRTSIITSAVPVTALTTPLGGVLVDVGGWQLAHAVMGGYAAAALVAVAVVAIPDPGHDPHVPALASLVQLRRDYVASAAWAIGTSGVLLFVGAQLEETFGVGPVGVGGVLAGTGIVGFVTTVVVSRLGDDKRLAILVPTLAASGLLALGWVFSPVLWLAITLVLGWSVTYWAGFALVQAVIGTDAQHDQAGALTFFQTPWSYGLAIGPAIVGFLVDRFGFTMIGIAALLSALVASVLFQRRQPQLTG